MNYIEEIFIDTPAKERNLSIKPETPKERQNCITLISGKNHTGKSHILDYVRQSLNSFNKNGFSSKKKLLTAKRSNIYVKLKNNDKLKFLLIIDIRNVKKFLERIPVNVRAKREGNLETSIKRLAHLFLKDEVDFILKNYFESSLDKKKWIEETSYRSNIVSQLKEEKNTIYPANMNNPMVSIFENAVNGQLYIGTDKLERKNENNLALYIKYEKDQIFPFMEWSEGQKVLFIMLLISHYGDYNLLMIDELENNLHPEYMTIILKEFKNTIPQIIITSHNPHLIFSKYIDRVIYINIVKNKDIQREKIELPNLNEGYTRSKRAFPPFGREITTLEKDLDKMSKVYQLFDNFDHELLRLSLLTYREINESIINSIKGIFSYGAIEENKYKTQSDIQSSKLGELILTLNKESLNILDYGAGKGRTYFEIKKDNIPTKLGKHRYYFWEPYEEYRNILKERIAELDAPLEVIETPENIQKDYYDVIFLSNVVHECNPNDFSKILEHCQYALKENGYLIIVELSPLLSSEKYAVSYTQDELARILDQSNLKVISNEKLVITNKSVDAYWTVSKKRNKEPLDKKKIKKVILKEWDLIEDKYARHYEGIEDVKSINDFNRLLSTLTILASMVSYRNGRWEDFQ